MKWKGGECKGSKEKRGEISWGGRQLFICKKQAGRKGTGRALLPSPLPSQTTVLRVFKARRSFEPTHTLGSSQTVGCKGARGVPLSPTEKRGN